MPSRLSRSASAIPASLLVSTLAVGGAARARDEAPEPPIEELVVTAPRAEKRLLETPAAVSLLDASEIQLGQQQLTLGESLQRVPGLFLQDRNNFAQDLRIAIRGFGARSNFGIRGIKVLVDGIPATFPDGQTQVDNVDLGSAERIEVIRGPSSSLYGATAGGVIRIESEEGPSDPFAEARAAFGSYGYRNYQAKGGGEAGPLRYFASLSRLELDGYRRHSRTENVLLNSKFRYDIDEDSDLGVVFNLVHAPLADDPGALDAEEAQSDRRQASPGSLQYDAGESVDQQQLGFFYRKSFGDRHEISAANYYVWRDLDNRLPFRDGGRVDLDRFFVGGGAGYAYSDTFFQRSNRLIVGFEVEGQHDERRRFDNDDGSRGALALDQVEDVTDIGVFLQDEFELLDDLELTLGARYDRVEFDVDDDFLSDGNDGGRLDFDELSPRVGLRWSPLSALHLYANVSTSFETPTTTELADPEGGGGFNSDLDAQTSLLYEAGAKGVFRGWVRYEVVGFHIEIDDELIPFEVPSMPGRDFFENAGKSRRSGLEVAVAVQPFRGLTASLAYTYSDFEFDRFQTETASFDGNEIPGVPRNQLYAEIAYRHPMGFHASWELLYVGDFFADNANTVENDSSVVSNLRVGFQGRFGDWEVAPFVGFNNLFDEKYNDNVRLNARSGRYFEPAPEFNVYGGLSLRYAFGEP